MIYLEATDIIALTIALTASLTLSVTTVLRNIQLTHARDYWRKQYQELDLATDPRIWEN